jgi:hypothetical protein
LCQQREIIKEGLASCVIWLDYIEVAVYQPIYLSDLYKLLGVPPHVAGKTDAEADIAGVELARVHHLDIIRLAEGAEHQMSILYTIVAP